MASTSNIDTTMNLNAQDTQDTQDSNRSDDNIVAAATAPGKGAIGIVRMSGNSSFTIAAAIIKKKVVRERAMRICNFYASDGEKLDQGIALFFPAPNSFSGEDMVELHAHGNPLILDSIVAAAVAAGARHAQAGEFSRRAYKNAKIDLAQAESIADVINSDTEIALRAAMKSLSGEFSKRVGDLNELVMQLRVYVEAALDFPTEEIDLLKDKECARKTEVIISGLQVVLEQSRQGVLVQEELGIVIIGKPNAGKSSLMNLLCRNDRAIVSEDAGTTRDFLCEKINIQGMSVSLTDTAGIRAPQSSVEKEGIERSWQQAKLSDIIICIYDALEDAPDFEEVAKLIHQRGASSSHYGKSSRRASARATIGHDNSSDASGIADIVSHLAAQSLLSKTIFIANKIDLLGAAKLADIKQNLNDKVEQAVADCILLSTKTGTGMQPLMDSIVTKSGKKGAAPLFSARKRHIESLDKALGAVQNGYAQLLDNGAGELFAEDLRQATGCLDEILGKTTTDDLLDRIFSEFCLGK